MRLELLPRRAKILYSRLGGPVVRMSSPTAAEFAKLVDNTYRNTMFAFANEVAMVATQLGLDSCEVIHAANYEYPRSHIPLPGPVSDYCLGKDPYTFAGPDAIINDTGPGALAAQGRIVNDQMYRSIAHEIDIARGHVSEERPYIES